MFFQRSLHLAVLGSFAVQTAYAQGNSDVKLKPFTFTPLPLGSIKPQGWLKDQLQLQADGLAGHEHEFYDIVKDNRWMGGGVDYSDLNEGLPYWFNALVGLAYALDDQPLIDQVHNVSDYILGHQNAETGWLGPETQYDSRNLWGRFPMALGLMQLAQADTTKTDDIVSALYKFVPVMDSLLLDGVTSDQDPWGQSRYADMNMVLEWLYESHPKDNTSQLIETMTRWQHHGIDWAGFYTQDKYLFNDINTYPDDVQTASFPYLHGVNVGQGLKTMGVNWRFLADDALVQRSHDAVNWTFAYHGAASGTILADERETSLQPQHGSELCTTVETMFSLSYLYQLFGEPLYADRAELAAFNAMPTQGTPDWWAHQYLSMPNQPFANLVPEHDGLWWNTNEESITYGVAPNYPCCAVNHPQGWQKFLAATFAQAGVNGLAHTLLAPAIVATTLGDGTNVTVATTTTYPFTDTLDYTTQASADFTLYVRVPAWQSGTPSVTVNGAAAQVAAPDAHGMLAIPVPSGSASVSYTLQPEIALEHRGNDTVSVHRGALLYAVDLGQDVTTAAASVAGAPASAQSVYYNGTSAWNLALDPASLQYHGPAGADSTELPNPLFDYQAPPNSITATACPIAWPLFHGVPGPVPLAGSRQCTGANVTVTLRPYGSLRARMVELPVMES